MLRRRRGLFAAAEMLDGSMATGAAAGQGRPGLAAGEEARLTVEDAPVPIVKGGMGQFATARDPRTSRPPYFTLAQ
jgi:hypothetical protein